MCVKLTSQATNGCLGHIEKLTNTVLTTVNNSLEELGGAGDRLRCEQSPASSAEVLKEVVEVSEMPLVSCSLPADQRPIGLTAGLNAALHEGTAFLSGVCLEEGVRQLGQIL